MVRTKTSISIFGKHSVYRCPAQAEALEIQTRRLSACMHPLRQSGFGLVECIRSSDVLSPRPTCLACRCAAAAARLKFKLCQTGHTPATMRPVALLAQRPQNNGTVAEFRNRGHDLSSVSA
jgi:hypothetical protein